MVALAEVVFSGLLKEGTEPDTRPYAEMIGAYLRADMIEKAMQTYEKMKAPGIELDTMAYAEMVGVYLRVDMIEKATQMYEKMKAAGRTPNEFTLMILIRNLEKARETDLVEFVKRDCVQYLDSPKKFLEDVNRKFVGIHSSILILALCSLYAYPSAWASL
ncbi:hypothetical protein EUGRSUZ_A00027 [Eucalyptus grandis]|uniref:Uncharacterized protein n=2 Tax=Eucalyptus grandis TaxID=71139 RepID=A0ACC3LZW2_EUCGR|nr:hypothetical protein EUGRSUZ_A00027 [Eucalyptus grandis]